MRWAGRLVGRAAASAAAGYHFGLGPTLPAAVPGQGQGGAAWLAWHAAPGSQACATAARGVCLRWAGLHRPGLQQNIYVSGHLDQTPPMGPRTATAAASPAKQPRRLKRRPARTHVQARPHATPRQAGHPP